VVVVPPGSTSGDFEVTAAETVPDLTRVVLHATAGHSVRTSTLIVRAGPSIPEAPLGLNATVIEDGIDLEWVDASPDEIGFTIERKSGMHGAWIALATLPANVIAYTDRTVSAESPYYSYRVLAFGSAGAADSNVAGVCYPQSTFCMERWALPIGSTIWHAATAEFNSDGSDSLARPADEGSWAADVNADGQIDLVVPSASSPLLVLAVSAHAGMAPVVVHTGTVGPPRVLAVADFDNDGRADVAVRDADGSTIWVLYSRP
jgi:hypothetical protein